MNDASAAIGLHRSTIQRLFKRERLRWDAADNVAVALGRHPCELWPTWFDLPARARESVGMLHMDRVLFEIPIYDQPEPEYERRRQNVWEERVSALVAAGYRQEAAESLTRDYLADKWGGWRFNRVVGWVVLRRDGRNIKAHLYWTTKQRVRRHERQFHHVEGDLRSHKVFECPVLETDSNSDIRTALAKHLDAVSKMGSIRRHHVYRETFDRVSEHLDWRGLIGVRSASR